MKWAAIDIFNAVAEAIAEAGRAPELDQADVLCALLEEAGLTEDFFLAHNLAITGGGKHGFTLCSTL